MQNVKYIVLLLLLLMNNDTLSSIFWTVALGQIKRVITCAYNWRMREKCSTSR